MSDTIVIGKRISQDVAAVWGLVTGTLSDQTDLQAALNAKITSVNGVNVIYVGKHGNDSNSGLSWQAAKLTFGAAITTAGAPTSSARVLIVCLDGGNYTLSSREITNPFTATGTWTANTILIPQYCAIYAPFATITGSVVLSDFSYLNCYRIVSQATASVPSTFDYRLGCCVIKQRGNQTTEGVSNSYAEVKTIMNYGGAAVSNWATLGTLFADIENIDVYQQNQASATQYGVGIGDAGQANGFGNIYADIGLIRLNSANTYCASLTQLGFISANVKRTIHSTGLARILHTAGSLFLQEPGIDAFSWGSSSKGYWFDGVDDFITTLYIHNLDTQSYSFEVFLSFFDGAGTYIIFDTRDAANDGAVFLLNAGKIDFRHNSIITQGLHTFTSGQLYHIIVAVTYGGTAKIYVNGAEVSYIAQPTINTAISTTATSVIGRQSYTAAYSYFRGNLNLFRVFNYALSASQIKSLYNNGQIGADVEYADKWGGTAEQTSGTLERGRRYRINTFAAGDSFTNVGAASNASGVVFVATGTTPTTWTNGSALIRVGAMFDLDMETGGNYSVFDKSTNAFHGTVSGAVPISREQIVKAVRATITGDTALTNIVPFGYRTKILANVKQGGGAGKKLNIGTSAGGAQVVNNFEFAANGLYNLTLVNPGAFSLTNNQTLYVNDDTTATAWSDTTALSFDLYFILEKVV